MRKEEVEAGEGALGRFVVVVMRSEVYVAGGAEDEAG
jgi:hypothetical protein